MKTQKELIVSMTTQSLEEGSNISKPFQPLKTSQSFRGHLEAQGGPYECDECWKGEECKKSTDSSKILSSPGNEFRKNLKRKSLISFVK